MVALKLRPCHVVLLLLLFGVFAGGVVEPVIGTKSRTDTITSVGEPPGGTEVTSRYDYRMEAPAARSIDTGLTENVSSASVNQTRLFVPESPVGGTITSDGRYVELVEVDHDLRVNVWVNHTGSPETTINLTFNIIDAAGTVHHSTQVVNLNITSGTNELPYDVRNDLPENTTIGGGSAFRVSVPYRSEDGTPNEDLLNRNLRLEIRCDGCTASSTQTRPISFSGTFEEHRTLQRVRFNRIPIPDYQRFKEFATTSETVAFTAGQTDGTDVLHIGGQKIHEAEQIRELTVIDDRIAYIARHQGQVIVVWGDRSWRTSGAAHLVDYDGQPAWVEYPDDSLDATIVVAGKKREPPCDSCDVTPLKVVNGKLTYELCLRDSCVGPIVYGQRVVGREYYERDPWGGNPNDPLPTGDGGLAYEVVLNTGPRDQEGAFRVAVVQDGQQGPAYAYPGGVSDLTPTDQGLAYVAHSAEKGYRLVWNGKTSDWYDTEIIILNPRYDTDGDGQLDRVWPKPVWTVGRYNLKDSFNGWERLDGHGKQWPNYVDGQLAYVVERDGTRLGPATSYVAWRGRGLGYRPRYRATPEWPTSVNGDLAYLAKGTVVRDGREIAEHRGRIFPEELRTESLTAVGNKVAYVVKGQRGDRVVLGSNQSRTYHSIRTRYPRKEVLGTHTIDRRFPVAGDEVAFIATNWTDGTEANNYLVSSTSLSKKNVCPALDGDIRLPDIDVSLKGRQDVTGFQAVQVVWHNDPDTNIYSDTSIYSRFDGSSPYSEYAFWDSVFSPEIGKAPDGWKSHRPVVVGKNTTLFGYSPVIENRENTDGPSHKRSINTTIHSTLCRKTNVSLEFRLFTPGGGERRIHLTSQNWTLPAERNATTNVSIKAPVPRDPFQLKQEGWYRIEMEVVRASGSSFNDDHPDNQDRDFSVEAVKTHPLEITLLPFAFQEGRFADTAYSSGGPPNTPWGPVEARTMERNSEPFLQGTFPVSDSPGRDVDVSSTRYVYAPQLWSSTLLSYFDYSEIKSLNDWRNVAGGNLKRNQLLEVIAHNVASIGWLTNKDRIVVLMPPGSMSVDGRAGTRIAGVKSVAFVEFGAQFRPRVLAQELAHSYGLWTDIEQYCEESLRTCDATVPANNGGSGWNASGYWVNRNSPRGKPLDGFDQYTGNYYNDFSFMGTAGGAPTADTWIDQGTYIELLNRFKSKRDPTVIGVRGLLLRKRTEGTVNETAVLPEWHIINGSVADRTHNDTGSYAIVLLDDHGDTLSHIGFNTSYTTLNTSENGGTRSLDSFAFRIPYHPDTAVIQVRNDTGHVLATRTLSSHSPTVSITAPTAGDTIDDPETTIRWNGSDPDDDSLRYTVFYSDNGGKQWRPIATDHTNESVEWNLEGLDSGSNYSVRVIASDGIRTTEATSAGNFTLRPVNATRGLPPVGDFENPPADPDGDGRHEDVNGDGAFTLADVQALLANRDDNTVQENPEAFDFNGDGQVSLADVQALLNEYQSG